MTPVQDNTEVQITRERDSLTTLPLPPTKNCFIHFPVRSRSEDEIYFDQFSKSCPASAILDQKTEALDSLRISDRNTNSSQNTNDCENDKSNNTLMVPTKTVEEPIHVPAEKIGSFTIALEISHQLNGRLGLSVDFSSGREVRITAIDEGLIQEWNRVHANRGEKLICLGDVILSINGITDAELMLAECRQPLPYIVELEIKEGVRPPGLCNNGSSGHVHGLCRPCAYFHKAQGSRRCDFGDKCIYCHECGPGELKRRKQVKLFFRKMMHNIRLQKENDNFEKESQELPSI